MLVLFIYCYLRFFLLKFPQSIIILSVLVTMPRLLWKDTVYSYVKYVRGEKKINWSREKRRASERKRRE